ncbi:WXG100 family type VII secretion target [Nocardia sp. NPDC023988]|uniref:WXG100 family type VII secretion target n=1 Tax=unclassified Nocardia TaxID=2637762 RepID=UPI0033E1F983
MSSSRFTVDVDHLEQVSTKLIGLAGFLGEQLDVYDAKMATLRSGSWSGAAADAFEAAQAQWVSAAREFVAGVQDAGEEIGRRRAGFLRVQAMNIRMSSV